MIATRLEAMETIVPVGFEKALRTDISEVESYIGLEAMDYLRGEKDVLGVYKRKDTKKDNIESNLLDLPDFVIPIGERSLEIKLVSEDEKRAIQLGFRFNKDFEADSSVGVFEPVGHGENRESLGRNTIKFLKIARGFVEAIDPECEVQMYPSDPQRSRLYKKTLRHLGNVRFMGE